MGTIANSVTGGKDVDEIIVEELFNIEHDEQNFQLLWTEEVIRSLQGNENESNEEQDDGRQERLIPTRNLWKSVDLC